MKTEFYSFGDALKELQIEKEELEQLIHEGEVKAYPTATGTLQFKRVDIDSMRLKKMSLPTIAVTEHNNDPEIIYNEENEENDIHNHPPFRKNTTMFIKRLENELDDMNPLLDISNSNPSISTVDNSMNLEKEDKTNSDDFFFTQMERDEFLETGELLFDLKEEKLPGDREAEELFPESRIEYINEFDNSNLNEPLKNAINLSDEEDGEEDILATSSHRYIPMPERYSKKHQKQNKILIYSISICASILLTLIILLGPLKLFRRSTAVSIYTVQMQRIELIQEKSATIEKLTLPVLAPKAGRLRWKIDINKITETIEKDTLIAVIAPEEELKKLEDLKKEQKKTQENIKTLTNDLNNLKSELKKLKDNSKTKTPEYNKLVKKHNLKVTQKKNLQDKSKNISTEIANLGKQLEKIQISVSANTAGYLIEPILDKSNVQENDVICYIQDGNNQFQASFSVDLDKEISYKENDTIPIQYEKETIVGVIDSIEKKEFATQLVVNLNNPHLENKALVNLFLHYKKDVLAIPITAIQENNGQHFIFIVDTHHRVHRRNIEINNKNEEFATINNIKAGEQIIAEQVSLQDNALVHEKK